MRWRPPTLAAVAVASLIVAGSGPAFASPTAARARPANCDDIHGRTLAQNDRWRVFETQRTRRYSTGWTQWACRRDRPHPARLMQLAHASADGGSWLAPASTLHGDRLIAVIGGGDHYGSLATPVMIDLARRVSVELWHTTFEGPLESSPQGSPWADATRDGGAIIGFDDGALPQGPSEEPPAVILNGAGGRTVIPSLTRSWALSRGVGGGPPGVYVTQRDGTTARYAVAGAATPPHHWRPGIVRIRRNPFRPSARPGDARERAIFVSRRATIDLEWPAVPAGAPTAWSRRPLRLASDDGQSTSPIVDLAPGSASEVHVLAAEGGTKLVTARFADQPATVSTRLLRWHQPPVTLDTDDVPSGDGDVAITSVGAVAISRPDRLVVFDPTRRVVPVGGLHDLAASVPSNYLQIGRTPGPEWTSIYFTTANGAPARTQLGIGAG